VFRFTIEDTKAGRTTAGPRLILVLSALWAVVAVYSVHAVLPTNVLELPFEGSLARPANALLPQGWAFFTKSPRDPILTAYEFDARGRAYRIPEITASDVRNLFGVNRRGRAIGTELALLLDLVPPDQWVECGSTSGDCVAGVRVGDPPRVASPVPGPRLCGEVVLAEESVVPYAYRELVDQRLRVDRAAHLFVECEP
jgi:antimicrobial peptide system SdpA family protein